MARGEVGRMAAVCVAFIINYAFYFPRFTGAASRGAGGAERGRPGAGHDQAADFFKVTLLQMVKRIVPPMSNEIITLVKDTSLARAIALQEVIWRLSPS